MNWKIGVLAVGIVGCRGEEAAWKAIQPLFPRAGVDVTDIGLSFR